MKHNFEIGITTMSVIHWSNHFDEIQCERISVQ